MQPLDLEQQMTNQTPVTSIQAKMRSFIRQAKMRSSTMQQLDLGKMTSLSNRTSGPAI